MIIDSLTIIFLVAFFSWTGYRMYRNKKNGTVSCTHCSKCQYANNCGSKKNK